MSSGVTLVTRGFILFQWFDFENFLTVHSQFPVGHQLVTVDLDPSLDKLHSTLLDATSDSFFDLGASMYFPIHTFI